MKPVPKKRMWTMAFLIIVAFCCLGFRLVDLQVMRHETLRVKAADNTQRKIPKDSRRGDIRDVRGNLLARSVFVKTVAADPRLVHPHQKAVAAVLAPLLEMPAADLEARMQLRTYRKSNGEEAYSPHVVLKRKVPLDQWERIQEAMEGFAIEANPDTQTKAEQRALASLRRVGVFVEPTSEQIRVYPNLQLAAHVLGFVQTEVHESSAGRQARIVGVEGLERACNPALTGVQGWRATEQDSRRRELMLFRDQEVLAKAGLNVVLTLDIGVQHIVESELRSLAEKYSPVSASAIVTRPGTGEILAMANWPTFNPAEPGAASADHRRNRVVTDVAEPGSTFKIVPISGALDRGVVRPQDRFDCEGGRFYFAGKTLRDHHPYKLLTVEEIIVKSSNIGTAKIGIQMGKPLMYSYITNFGFGTRTGISLPGEVSGILHPPSEWSKLSISRIPMGQGIAVTSLQMIMAMGAMANGGILMQPMLIDRFEDDDGRVVLRNTPKAVRRVVSPQAARQMVQALKGVTEPGGTAQQAALRHYTVAGKTGTAQKPVHGRYAAGKYYASFIGFFPADNPELCISIVVDEPDPRKGYYGGAVVGPAFQGVAERVAKYLAIPPDRIPDTARAAKAGHKVTN